MPSQSLNLWTTVRSAALDEIELAHSVVGRGDASPTRLGRGRRVARRQIEEAYTVLLSSHLQGFCRDLHSQCSDVLAQSIGQPIVRASYQSLLTSGLKLDHGNPNAGNIGSDFNHFGLNIWNELRSLDRGLESRKNDLEQLNLWRNAIAHQDFNPQRLGATRLHLTLLRKWRRSCQRLASLMDEVMRRHLGGLTGTSPW